MERGRLFVLVSLIPIHRWEVADLYRYTMLAVFPALYIGYKVIHKTKILKPEEIDLVKDLDTIEDYERNYIPQPPAYVCL